MDGTRFWRLLLLLYFALPAIASGPGSIIRSCLKTCARTGCVGGACLPSCSFLNSTIVKDEGQGKLPSGCPIDMWREWVCKTECGYHCSLSKETEEAGFAQNAIGYRDDWCLARSVDLQEESKKLYLYLAKTALSKGFDLGFINERASAALSVLNIFGHLFGFLVFVRSVQSTHTPARGPYPYKSLWAGFGILSIMYWVSRYLLHARQLTFDKHLESSLEVLLAIYSLSLAIIRVGKMRTEASRVIVAAPAIAFLYSHLMYINYCTYDYGLNMQLCLALGTVQYLLWIAWAGMTVHPARYQLWFGAAAASLLLYLRFNDLSHLWPALDGDRDAFWVASSLPLTNLWWSFATSDAAHWAKLSKKDTRVANGMSKDTPVTNGIASKKAQ